MLDTVGCFKVAYLYVLEYLGTKIHLRVYFEIPRGMNGTGHRKNHKRTLEDDLIQEIPPT